MTDEVNPNLQAASELIAQQVNRASQDSLEQMRRRNRAANLQQYGCDCDRAKCCISCPRYLTHYASPDEFWAWWAATTPPDIRDREVFPAGKPVFKGGGKSGRKRRKKPPKSWFNNPFLD